MLWPGLGEQLWPARAAASEQEIKLGVNWRKERREIITEIRKIPHGKLSLSPFSWWILCVQRTKFWNSEEKKPHKLKIASSWSSTLRRVLHVPENPHCTANEGALRAANLHSTRYLCRGGTKAIPLRDSFNMIQRKDELQQGLGSSPFLFL